MEALIIPFQVGASGGATRGGFVDSHDGWGGDEGGKECVWYCGSSCGCGLKNVVL